MYRVNPTKHPRIIRLQAGSYNSLLPTAQAGFRTALGSVLRPALPVLSSLHSFLLALIPTVLFFSPSSLFFPLAPLPHSFPHFLPGVAPVLEPRSFPALRPASALQRFCSSADSSP